jgi:hypothetical protein
MTDGSDRAFLDAFDADGGRPVTFHADGTDLVVVDRVERLQFVVGTDRTVDPASRDPDGLLFPVDTAAAVTVERLSLSGQPTVYVRDSTGEMLADAGQAGPHEFPAGDYYLEVEAPLKLYLRVSGPLTVEDVDDRRRVTFDGPQEVVVGGRSLHERPAATVTTTDDPADVMAAVSTFGSALKTTSPERTFPTLRGHPPLVERGDALAVPDAVAPPETGVTVEVPPELRYVYPVAPLAHFLGARVVPGDHPRLTTDAGIAYDLAPDGEFETEVERVLARSFLLDCLVRTEGLYEVDLHERERLEPDLDLDLAALYDRPLAERLAAYLAVDHRTVAPAIPDWKLTTYVETTPSSVEALPFLVDDLAVVRTDAGTAGPAGGAAGDDEQAAAVEGLLRDAAGGSDPPTPAGVAVEDAGTMERAWVGEGVVRGASKVTPTAYRNRLDRSPTDADLAVTVVCNDPEMGEEPDAVAARYRSAGDGRLSVDRRDGVTTAALRQVLASESDFLHYVGHVDASGIQCADGTLDARTLEEVGVEAFLLNACTSYEQGMALVDAGAVGGVVTLADVVDDSAAAVGSTLARLLDSGYPLRPALEVARHASHAGDDYLMVGDGTLQVAETQGTALEMYRLRRDGEAYVLTFVSYATVAGGMGTMNSPHLDGNDQYYLGPGTLDEFRFEDPDRLLEFLTLETVPTLIEGSLFWSTAVDRRDLP